MNLVELRASIARNNDENAHLSNCIYPKCQNKIYPLWDNEVLCEEHNLLAEFWFYERNGYEYCPDVWDMDSGQKLPKPAGSDENMTAYRKRYCDWIAALSPSQYTAILKHLIGDKT